MIELYKFGFRRRGSLGVASEWCIATSLEEAWKVFPSDRWEVISSRLLEHQVAYGHGGVDVRDEHVFREVSTGVFVGDHLVSVRVGNISEVYFDKSLLAANHPTIQLS